jgi:hypothetical protein
MMVLVAQIPVEVRKTMSPTDVQPSSRLLRAAAAEREGVARQRERLQAARELLLAELRRIDGTLSTLSERELLLERLAPVAPGPVHRLAAEPVDTPAADSVALPVSPSSSPPDIRALRGPSIREAAVRLLLVRGGAEALHYRAWFELLAGAGYTVAGKDPLAVFLTQISRSPAVRKTTQSGVYELDMQAPTRLRRRIGHLHDELRELSMRSSDTSDRSAVRARRNELTAAIGHSERALEEAERVLSTEQHSEPAAETLRPLLARAS